MMAAAARCYRPWPPSDNIFVSRGEGYSSFFFFYSEDNTQNQTPGDDIFGHFLTKDKAKCPPKMLFSPLQFAWVSDLFYIIKRFLFVFVLYLFFLLSHSRGGSVPCNVVTPI